LELLALAVLPHFLRQAHRASHDAQRCVARKEAAQHEQEEQVEREFHPIRRRDEERVPRREPRRERDGDRRASEGKKQEEDAHWSATASAPPSPLPFPAQRDPVPAAAREALRGCARDRAPRRAAARPRAAWSSSAAFAPASRACRSTA